jgi:hypothetical protein
VAKRPPLSFIFDLIARSAFHRIEGVQQHPIPATPDQLGVTFIGHSSFLIQIAGLNLLIDPVFANWLVVLKRMRRPGIAIEALPPIDAVLLSHAHMDHLNLPSLRKIIGHTQQLSGKAPEVIVPWGVADLVEKLGFSRIHTLEWWKSKRLGNLDITMTPAKHWGARRMRDAHRGYGGYVLSSNGHSIYHAGDTGYFKTFREMGPSAFLRSQWTNHCLACLLPPEMPDLKTAYCRCLKERRKSSRPLQKKHAQR